MPGAAETAIDGAKSRLWLWEAASHSDAGKLRGIDQWQAWSTIPKKSDNSNNMCHIIC
jgi:hypothetical protein